MHRVKSYEYSPDGERFPSHSYVCAVNCVEIVALRPVSVARLAIVASLLNEAEIPRRKRGSSLRHACDEHRLRRGQGAALVRQRARSCFRDLRALLSIVLVFASVRRGKLR